MDPGNQRSRSVSSNGNADLAAASRARRRRSRTTAAQQATSQLRVSICDGKGRPVRAPGLAVWLARVAPRGVRGIVNLALLGDAEVRALNARYRRYDSPTDVLSFPSGRASHPERPGRPRNRKNVSVT